VLSAANAVRIWPVPLGRMSVRVLFRVAQTSQSAVSRVSKPARATNFNHSRPFQTLPIWKSAIQQVWKPALLSDGRASTH
jgi:hypothetical protein